LGAEVLRGRGAIPFFFILFNKYSNKMTDFSMKFHNMMRSFGFEIGGLVYIKTEDNKQGFQIIGIDEIKTVRNGQLTLRLMEASPVRELRSVQATDLEDIDDSIKVYTVGTLVICGKYIGKVVGIDEKTRIVEFDAHKEAISIKDLKLPSNQNLSEMKRKIRDVSAEKSFLASLQKNRLNDPRTGYSWLGGING
jgi:hypothetical protein